MHSGLSRLCLMILMAGALALAGCGSDGDTGMQGPPGAPGEGPTDAEIAAEVEAAVEAALADQEAPEVDTSELEAQIEEVGSDVADVISDAEMLGMTPAERILASIGGTAPTGSKADVAKAQADIIAGLKGTSATPVWYDAETIINLPKGDTIAGALGLHNGDAGDELANLHLVPNVGPDGVLKAASIVADVAPSHGIVGFFNRVNDRRTKDDQIDVSVAIKNLAETPAPTADSLFDVYADALTDPMKLNPDTDTKDTVPTITATRLTVGDIASIFSTLVGFDYDIDATLQHYWDAVFKPLLDEDGDGDGFTAERLATVLLPTGTGTPANGADENNIALFSLPATTEVGKDVPELAEGGGNQSDIDEATATNAVWRFILEGLLSGGIDAPSMAALAATPDPTAPAGSAADNYPIGAIALTKATARAHLDTLTLVPVMDVDGVSLVRYSVDSALLDDHDNNPATDPAPVKDGYYRLTAYGAWLSDSYFAMHTYSAVTHMGTALVDPTYKKAGPTPHFAGGNPASLAGLNQSASWTGAMIGHDTKATTAATAELQGNAALNARIETDTLANPDEGGVAVMDVMLSNITNQNGLDARVTEIAWTGLELSDRAGTTPAGFIKSDGEVEGWLFDDGNEVVGKFNHMGIVGAYGATLDTAMDASQ